MVLQNIYQTSLLLPLIKSSRFQKHPQFRINNIHNIRETTSCYLNPCKLNLLHISTQTKAHPKKYRKCLLGFELQSAYCKATTLSVGAKIIIIRRHKKCLDSYGENVPISVPAENYATEAPINMGSRVAHISLIDLKH